MKRLPWLLLMAALLLPGLAVVPRSQHVFWVPEAGVWSMLWPWAALAAWWSTRRESAPPLPKYLGAVFGALAACWALAVAFSVRVDLALQSLWLWLGYAAVFFATWRLAVGPSHRRRLVWLLLAYGALNCILAVIQVMGLDPLPWATTFDGRAGALLGNPNFLGGHLALLLPLALALALDARQSEASRWRRWSPWGLLLLLALGLLLTQTRGAWIGAAVGVAALLLLAARHMGPLLRRHRGMLLGLGSFLLLGSGAYLLSQPRALERLKNSFQGDDSELSRRFFLMRKASQLASLSPLWGVGPGNLRIQFARVQVQGLAKEDFNRQPYVVSEHAHNDFLQMAADAGLPAALLWLALMLLALRHLYELFAVKPAAVRQGDGLLALGVFGSALALGVHGLANFPFLIVPTQAALWCLAALALRSAAVPPALPAEGLIEADDMPVAASPAPRLTEGRAKALVVCGLLVAAANTVYQGRRFSSDRMWWIGNGEFQLKRADQASTWLLAAAGLDPREDRLWHLHGMAELERGFIWNSIGSLRRAHALAPYDPEIAVRLGRALVENRVYDEAETVLRGVTDYAPNFYDVWEPLAAAFFMQQKHAEAVQAYDWMIFFNVNAESAHVNKAASQGSQGLLPEALLTLKQAEQRFPDSGKVFLNLAITYFKLGMRQEAKTALKRAEALVPGDPQVDQLKKAFR